MRAWLCMLKTVGAVPADMRALVNVEVYLCTWHLVFLFMMVGGVGQIAKELDFEAVEKMPAQKLRPPKKPTSTA